MVNFVNACAENSALQNDALLHGACLTFLDLLGSRHTSVDNSSVWIKCKDDTIFLQDLLIPIKTTSEVSIITILSES
ncbi:unnamed protein product, partial [Allacma fusca]